MSFDDFGALEDDEENIENTFLTFQVAQAEYAVHVANVTEVVRIQKIFPVPDLPQYIRGVINLRGRVIPLLDVRARFGLAEAPYTDRTVVIVLESGGATTGLVVDAVLEVAEIPPHEVESVAASNVARGAGAVITGMGKRGERVSFILDVPALVESTPETPHAAARAR